MKWNARSKCQKEGKGARDVVLEFGGVRWEPGAYVYADADGVVVAREDLSASVSKIFVGDIPK
ncbi:S-adenosylmethionine--2-demethylmenaquinone methyltransferase [Geobacillus zalihae]|nr:S-adenosylmethionine--2-demethylmenaquinone methyltransferase [Geobacillus zalihae]WKA49214.1 S-adenosylmethionine--2-demethylmenaquinone methyltransferase [Geobacillus zalihae]